MDIQRTPEGCKHYEKINGVYKTTIDTERKCRLCNKVFSEESIREHLVFIKLINHL